MAIVVADVVRFGSLTEGEVGLFSVTLLPECLSSARKCRAAYCNTWGDAIIAFFDSIGDGLDYALTLRDLFRNREWGSGPDDSFNEPLAIRIALHSADVHIAPDDNVPGGQIFGTQISLAARIEPITIPNEVFASEAAVAQLKAQRRSKVVFKNLGTIALPKEDREETIFWVRRVGESAKLPPLAVSRRIQILPSTEAALTDIARRSQRLHSIRIAVLNGAVSLRFVLGACEERLARECKLQILAYDPDPTKLRATELADGSRRTYLEGLQRQVKRAPTSARATAEYMLHASELGAWPNEQQEAQLDRLKELLSDYEQRMGKIKPRIHARATPRASVGRCWVLDDVAYFTPHFQPHRMQPVLAAAAGSELYTALVEHFEYVWADTLLDDAATLFLSRAGAASRRGANSRPKRES